MESFKHLSLHLYNILEKAQTSYRNVHPHLLPPKLFIVGNKKDKADAIVVTQDLISEWQQTLGSQLIPMEYFETSALTGEQVMELFEQICAEAALVAQPRDNSPQDV